MGLVESGVARQGQLVVGRLLPGSDLIRGLEQACEEHRIRFAAVMFAYGSLSSASFKVLQRPGGSERAILMAKQVNRRVEFLAGQGLVCVDEEGQRATHLHGSIADESGAVLGGHFLPGANPVYNNLDFSLVELLGVRLIRRPDPATDTVEMVIEALADAQG